MPKTRRPRLSWFRFYVDDFLGGTGALTAPECGRYLLLLLHQWGTKELQSIPSDPDRLRLICRGEDPGDAVLAKFQANGENFRNERLAGEWLAAKREYDSKAAGGGVQIPGRIPHNYAPKSPVQIPGRTGPPSKNQEPRTKNQTETTDSVAISPVASASWSKQACEDWIDRYGGTAPGGQIGKALKPLVEKHTWPMVRQAWRSYLEQSEAEYASASRFAATFGRWSGTSAPGGKASVIDANKAVLQRFVAKE